MTFVTVSVSAEMAPQPATIFALVSDLPRMGEWSPEATGGRWKDGAGGPAVGARFSGTNRNGIHRWSTTATITEMDAPRVFAFDVTFMGIRAANWRFEIEPIDHRCRVTETWTDRRSRWFAAAGVIGTGVRDRASHNRDTMRATLESLAAAAEAAE